MMEILSRVYCEVSVLDGVSHWMALMAVSITDEHSKFELMLKNALCSAISLGSDLELL